MCYCLFSFLIVLFHGDYDDAADADDVAADDLRGWIVAGDEMAKMAS